MNFAKELTSVGLHCNCLTCVHSNCVNKDFSHCCINYFPSNMRSFMDRVLFDLRVNTEKSSDKKLVRHPVSDSRNKMTCDGNTLDQYYVSMINDVLSQIRKGKTAYLFHLSQIQEIMRFEDVDTMYDSDGDCFVIKARKK